MTQVEKMLAATVRVRSMVLKLHEGSGFKADKHLMQYLAGHVISFPQPLTTLTTLVLSRLTNSLVNCIKVIFLGSNGSEEEC